MLDMVLFVGFPYAAVAVAIVGGIYRYRSDRFSYSSFASQFLDNKTLVFGSVPWHYGILLILGAHVVGALTPGLWQEVLSDQTRLYFLEISGLTLALFAMIGLVLLILRRLGNARVFRVTTTMDWVLLAALLAQVALGFWVALFYRWGSDWYLHTAVPWMVSLVQFKPQIQYVSALPWIVKAHMLGGFVIIALFPFTRLVHVVTYPYSYLWRPYQLVRWNRRTRALRQMSGGR